MDSRAVKHAAALFAVRLLSKIARFGSIGAGAADEAYSVDCDIRGVFEIQ